ncbi:MAG: hypothetical protein QXT73_08875 [Candidatus Methanomethylicaceae archaeon]
MLALTLKKDRGRIAISCRYEFGFDVGLEINLFMRPEEVCQVADGINTAIGGLFGERFKFLAKAMEASLMILGYEANEVVISCRGGEYSLKLNFG